MVLEGLVLIQQFYVLGIITSFFPHFLQPNYTEIAYYCNLWRNYNDIQVCWTKFQ